MSLNRKSCISTAGWQPEPPLGFAWKPRRAGAQAVNRVYLETARLLTQVAPLVLVADTFALKGGTVIAPSGRFPNKRMSGT